MTTGIPAAAPRRARRGWTCLAIVLVLIVLAAAALFLLLSASRSVSSGGVRARLTRDAQTVAAAASQVGRAPGTPTGAVRLAAPAHVEPPGESAPITPVGDRPADLTAGSLRRADGARLAFARWALRPGR